MPTVDPADLTLLRTSRHATLLSLSVYHPQSCWTAAAQVDGAQTTGDTTITVKNVVQVVAPRKNYQVLIGSTVGGREYGEARFKSYSAPTLTVGAHNCALPNNAYVTIKEEIKPTAIHVSISATDVVSEDGNTAYTNENVQYMPLAKIGCPAVAYIDPSTGLATVNFYSASQAFGGALSTYAWTFPSGTPGTSAAAGTSGAPIAVTWDTAGEYYVRFTVTDANNKSHTRYVPVFIYDENNPPYRKIEVSGLSGDVDGGSWSCSIKVMESDASVTEFPEQALCVISAEDWYGSTKKSIGGRYTYRENIVFVGYIRKGTITKNPFTGYVEFDLESVSGVMDNIWELASTLTTTTGTPSGWHTLKNMTHTLAAHHVLTQHSTITEIADCYFNVAPYQCNSASLNDASLLGQLRDACCSPVRSRAGCSAQGMFYLEGNPQILEVSGRPTTDILDTDFRDLREIDFGDELQEKQTSQIDFSGENISQDPIFSLAPATPWQSGQSEKIDGIRVVNQAEANIVSGLYEGYRNNSFADVVINWRGNYRVFDVFPSEYLQVTIAAAQNARGIVWSNQKCWIKSVSLDYTPGILTVSTTIEKDVVGAVGATGNYPQTPPTEPTPTYPPQEPPFPDPPEPPTPPHYGDWRAEVYIATAVNGVYYSADFTGPLGAMPTWSTVNTGLPVTTLLDMRPDPFNPRLRQYVLTSEHVVADDYNRLFRRVSGGAWTQILQPSDLRTLFGLGSTDCIIIAFNTDINVNGYVGVVFKAAGANYRFYYAYSTDYGATWNAGNGGTSFLTLTGGATNNLQIGYFQGASPYAGGQVLYVPAYYAGVFSTNSLQVSVNKGTSWTEVRTDIDWEDVKFSVDNYQDVCFAMSNAAFGLGAKGIWRSLDRGANFTQLLDCYAVPGTGAAAQRYYGLNCLYPGSGTRANTIRCIAASNAAGDAPFTLRKTTDGGTVWSTITLATNDTDGDTILPCGLSVVQDAGDKIYFLTTGYQGISGHQPRVLVSEDDGATMVNKGGTNWDTPPYTNAIPYDAGGIVHILQVWN